MFAFLQGEFADKEEIGTGDGINFRAFGDMQFRLGDAFGEPEGILTVEVGLIHGFPPANGGRSFSLDGKMESVRRAAISTDYTDDTDFTESFGLVRIVRPFTFWVSGPSDIRYSKSVKSV